ncbi:MAG TPA: AzlD domain-containing protein [Anaerolineales bacterium]|nr:AzlD domain-containing protein [Anaerolineales bacterium]
MSPGAFWLAVVGGMLVTFATRASFFILPQTERLPRLFLRGLRFVPPAVLGALVATMVADPLAESGFRTAWPRLAAVLVAAIFGWRTRNMWGTIGLGMVSLWVLQSVASP